MERKDIPILFTYNVKDLLEFFKAHSRYKHSSLILELANLQIDLLSLSMSRTALLALALTLVAGLVYLNYPSAELYTFQRYEQEYQKNYSPSLRMYRSFIFYNNLRAIEKHNQDPKRSYEQGVNKFTDLTPAQFSSIYLTPILDVPATIESEEKFPTRLGVQIDWVAAGKVRPVEDQGHQCGASWAFSAVGAIQSAFMIKGTPQINLSEQELIDCSGSYGNYGCNGGYMSYSFKYVQEKGINSEANYPYVGVSQKCTAPTTSKFTIKSHKGDSKGCDFLLNALSKGPVSVAVDASNFYSYKSGVFDKCGNSPSSGALVVGVTDDYWLIKMSFGANFADKGYVRIKRGNTCAVCEVVSYPEL